MTVLLIMIINVVAAENKICLSSGFCILFLVCFFC